LGKIASLIEKSRGLDMSNRINVVVAVIVAMVVVAVTRWQAAAGQPVTEPNAAGVSSSDSRLWVLRLRPGDDLVGSIMQFARRHSIEAGGIVTCVGSLDRAQLRFANQPEYENLNAKGKHFEIVSLVGTFGTTDHHLHLSVANDRGEVFGGHAGSGCRVYTTAEIILIEGVDWSFRRETDAVTTYRELSPRMRNNGGDRKAE
jgi:uncharacterized protein